MTNKTHKLIYAGLSLSLLVSSAIATAAKYDQEIDIFNNLDKSAPLGDKSDGFLPLLDSFDQPVTDFKEQHEQVLMLFKQGKLDEAEKKITQLIKQSPKEAEFHNLQAFLETLKNNPVAAEKSFQQAIDLDSSNVIALIGLAKLSLEAKKIDKAQDLAKKALAVNQKAYTADLILASVALMQNNPSEAEAVLLNAQKKNKGNFQSEIEIVSALGRVYALQQKQPKITQLVQELVGQYPNNKEALSLLVAAQIANQNKAEAQQTLAQIIKLDPKDIDHRLMLARLWMEQPGKEKEILKILDEAVAMDSGNPHGLLTKASYFIKLKQTDAASAVIDIIDKQFPDLAAGKQLRGDLYLSNKQLEQALISYQQAYQMQPSGGLLDIMINIMAAQGRFDDAIKFLSNQLVKQPQNDTLHFKLATIYQHLNDQSKAEQHYQAILKAKPDNILALNNLAWLYFQQNKPQALELAKQAYEQATQAPEIIDTYGYILVKQGRVKEGIALLEKAMGLASQSYDIQYHLAEAYVADGNTQKAQVLLAKITSVEQNFANKKLAVDLLEKIKMK